MGVSWELRRSRIILTLSRENAHVVRLAEAMVVTVWKNKSTTNTTPRMMVPALDPVAPFITWMTGKLLESGPTIWLKSVMQKLDARHVSDSHFDACDCQFSCEPSSRLTRK